MATGTDTAQQTKFRIPWAIKLNTLLFASSQAFVGAGMQMNPALGALTVLRLTGSAALAGLGTSTVGISRLLIAFPAGKVSDSFGRKPALMMGLVLGGLGALLTGLAVMSGSFPLLVGSFLVFGLGMGAAQQIRVAAADMYPPEHRGLGMGYVLSGSLVGVLIAPAIVALAQALSPRMGIDELALPWLFVPLLTVPAMVCVFMIRPDPREIAKNLAKYYPGYNGAAKSSAKTGTEGRRVSFVRHYPKMTATVASFAVQGNMSMVMFLTSLVLHNHGQSLASITMAVSIHVAGMYGFSMPLGWLSDRVGRRAVMLVGVVIAGMGSMLVPSSSLFWVVTSGTFLVGLGWSCVYVATTALIADTSAPEERGRAVGVIDTVSWVPGVILPIVSGPIAAYLGMRWVGVLGMCLMVPPFFLLLALREPLPGKYVWGPNTAAQASAETDSPE